MNTACTDMKMTTDEKLVPPDVLSYCLENKKFRERWQDIYKSADEHIRDTRLYCKELFDSENWKNGKQYVLEYDETDPKKEAAYKPMFNMIIKHFTSLERKVADQSQRLSQKVVYDNIRENYEKNPKPFISSMCIFLQEEERLLNQFLASEDEVMEVCSDDTDALLRSMEEYSKNVNIHIHELEAVEDELNKKLGSGQCHDGDTGPSAPEEQNRHIQTKLQLLDILKSYLEEIETQAVEAEAILARKMLNFKKHLQFFYVDLVNQKPIIEAEVERGYSWMGQILYNILKYTLPKLERLSGVDMVQSTSWNLKQCFKRLLHGSFVVIEQQKHIIKVELGSKKRNKDADATGEEAANQKFRCPKFFANVRLLACDKIDCIGKVKAQFCNEAEVNVKFNSGEWDCPCEIKLKAKTDESTFEKKAIATFKKMEIEKFERKPDVQVCEDKFRIVFTTKVKVADEEILVHTISLPIVVTTGASQSCNVHGSLLWQCFSTQDAFHLPIETVNSLRWHTVFEMLNQKMLTLGGRDLCPDEKDHLGSRLMLEDNPIPDEMDIPFRRFCVEKMMDIQEGDDKKKSATFWMWFLAVFNLTKSHLKDYWNDGLIAGFINKGTAEQRLKKMEQPHVYTYLLRFSDKVITDGQGQNLCGAISATVLYKNQKGHWKCFPTEPFKADKFKKMSLAQLVKNTCIHVEIKVHLLEWLYNIPSLSINERNSFAQCVEDTYNPGKINVHLLQRLYKSPTLSERTDDVFKLDNAESRCRRENPYKKFEDYIRFEGNLIVSLSDLSLEEDSCPETKRDIKKAVGPSKKREATEGDPGVIKNRRLSESQQEPNMHSDALISPLSLPPESHQMQAIPHTVLEYSGGESQDSMGSQPQTTTLCQRMPYIPDSPQDLMDQSFSTALNESLSSTHSSDVDCFQTINENDLFNTCFPDEVSPAPSTFPIHQPSPANSVNSSQSPDHNTKSVTMASTVYAPASRKSPDIAVQRSQGGLAKIDEQMLLFEKLKSKLGGGSSESSVLSSSDLQGFSSQVAATPQSTQNPDSPLAASPAWSIQTDSLQSPFSQSSSAGSVVSTIVEPVMESVEAILNDPDHKSELIENLKCVFSEINSSLRDYNRSKVDKDQRYCKKLKRKV